MRRLNLFTTSSGNFGEREGEEDIFFPQSNMMDALGFQSKPLKWQPSHPLILYDNITRFHGAKTHHSPVEEGCATLTYIGVY